jgi:hypothetical protein
MRRRSATAAGLVALGVALGGIALAPAAAAPTASGLVTRNVHHDKTSIGTLVFFGEIVNRTSKPAGNVGLEVSLLNQAGQRLARGTTLRISRNVLKPGEVAVWEAQMSDAPKAWARTSIRAVEQIGTEEAQQQDSRRLRVAGVKLAAENPGFSQKATGRITNTGKDTVKVAQVLVALYDGSGKLVYVADDGLLYPWPSTQLLKPGKTAPFRASVLGYTKKPARTVVYVRASTRGANGFYAS